MLRGCAWKAILKLERQTSYSLHVLPPVWASLSESLPRAQEEALWPHIKALPDTTHDVLRAGDSKRVVRGLEGGAAAPHPGAGLASFDA